MAASKYTNITHNIMVGRQTPRSVRQSKYFSILKELKRTVLAHFLNYDYI